MYRKIEGTALDFASLSLRDLLAARDQYHFHLMNKENVVGTAVGRYLIRDQEQGRPTLQAQSAEPILPKEARTFERSSVRDFSWPCVLVLVKQWVRDFATGGNAVHPEEMVPRILYMADGRLVPVCVVCVDPVEPEPPIPAWHWPSTQISPGCPIIVEHQGQQRVASIGCLVSDGHTTYALTNRHVSGEPGEIMYSLFRGRQARIGVTSDKQITRRMFSDVYPDYPGRRTFLNLDVGLVQIDDLRDWTSAVFELGAVGELADLHEANLGLNLIDAEVTAHGAASGELRGKIKGLFYRYKSVGGYDYVADFLIAPSTTRSTQLGDSGTVWHLIRPDQTPGLLPLAVEWGAQALSADGGGRQFSYALATSLSNVCKLLDVELVHERDIDVHPTWGQLGHYGIGTFAVGAVKDKELGQLMTDNVDRISFEAGELTPAKIKAAIKKAKSDKTFIPLSDVPDLVWKNVPKKVRGGRDRQAGIHTTGPEHPVHYADIDEPHPTTGKTLLQLCLEDDANLDVDVWRRFYDDCGHKGSSDRGCLPFRVWQLYDVMVDALDGGDLDRFVCAAGILSHYVGDACQPLHGSMFADGFKDQPTMVTKTKKDGTTYEEKSHVGAGVHTVYETVMIDAAKKDIVAGIPPLAGEFRKGRKLPKTGKAAAMEIIELMHRTAQRLPPKKIVNAYVAAGGTKTVAVAKALWKKFDDKTIETMADGADILALIWDGAWSAGKGDKLKAQIGPRDMDALQLLYEDLDFAPSLDLDHIEAVLK